MPPASRKDRIRVQIKGKEYNVVGGDFQTMLAAVKQIPGRRFLGDQKVWLLPGAVGEVRQFLADRGLKLSGGTPVESAGGLEPPAPRDRIRLLVQGNPVAVVGGSFQDMLAVVKNFPRRRFNAETKVWEVEDDLGVVKGMVEAAGFELEGAENIPLGPVPPMEPLDIPPDEPPPPFEPPPWDEPDLAADEWLDPPAWDEPDEFIPPPTAFSPVQDWPDFGDPPPARPSAPPSTAAAGDQIRLRVGRTRLSLTGGSFQAMLAVVREIPGRRFNPDEKLWEIPADVSLDSVQQAVKAAGFRLSPEGD